MNLDMAKFTLRSALKEGKAFVSPEDFFEREIVGKSYLVGGFSDELKANIRRNDLLSCKQAWVALQHEGVL